MEYLVEVVWSVLWFESFPRWCRKLFDNFPQRFGLQISLVLVLVAPPNERLCIFLGNLAGVSSGGNT